MSWFSECGAERAEPIHSDFWCWWWGMVWWSQRAKMVEIAEQDMLFKLSTDLHTASGHAQSGGDAKLTQTYKVPDGSAEFRQQCVYSVVI